MSETERATYNRNRAAYAGDQALMNAWAGNDFTSGRPSTWNLLEGEGLDEDIEMGEETT